MDKTIKLSRKSIPVRIYTSRLYNGNAERADFCSLFWATLLSPFFGFMFLYGSIPVILFKSTRKAVDHALIEHTAVRADRLAAWWQGLATGLFITLLVVFCGTLLALLGYGFYESWAWTLVGLGCLAIGAGLIFLLVLWIERCDRHGPGWFRLGVKAVKNRTCPRVEIES